jgi:hypothetical protein
MRQFVRPGASEVIVAVVGSERRQITQRYIQVNVAPDGGGSLLCTQDADWLSPEQSLQRAARARYRQAGRTDVPFTTYMIVGQSTPIGINQYGAAYKVVQALEAQGYTVTSHQDRAYRLELTNPQAVEDAGPSSDVLLMEPSATGCARLLGRLMARRTVSS